VMAMGGFAGVALGIFFALVVGIVGDMRRSSAKGGKRVDA